LFIRKRKKGFGGFLESGGFIRVDIFSVTLGKAIDEESPLPFLKDDDASIPT
jgi:hypothetical protein